MDLILWRHAEAEELPEGGMDLDRNLTRRGLKQAARMARWLEKRLPDDARVLCSPARRTEQTVSALGRKHRSLHELGPERAASELLAAAGWPNARLPTLVVGHQPTLGRVLALLLGMQAGDCSVRKGAVWWLRSRIRDGVRQTVLVTVQDPDLL